jgi:hypothetical protein
MAVRKAYCVDGVHDFVIDLKPQSNGTIKIYAPICPDDPHGKCSTTHHRYESGEICVVAGKEPRDYDRAEALARYWAQRYSDYVSSPSGTFNDNGARVRV